MDILNICGSQSRPLKILAPMVNHSNLAYRTLARKYGADICYTEMVHCKHFLSTKSNPQTNNWYTTNSEEKPLVIQIAGHDPEIMLEASKKMQNHCDAIDINLGCPQNIARRGFYGSYLQNDLELTSKIIQTLSHSLDVPLFCKIRIFDEKHKTLDYCQMIQNSGCKTLAVHGRTREQKGINTGLANWDIIRDIKKTLRIPVISNGNILCHSDIQKCYQYTKCDGVMVAESHLYNPTIFSDANKSCFEILNEYFDLCKLTKTRMLEIKSHVFKILHLVLDGHPNYKQRISIAHTLEDLTAIINELSTISDRSLHNCVTRIRKISTLTEIQ